MPTVPTPPKKKSTAAIVLAIVIFVVLVGLFVAIIIPAHSSEIIPGVTASGVQLGGLSPAAARSALEMAYQQVARDGITLTERGQSVQLPISITTNTELVTDAIVRVDIATTVEHAARVGHSTSQLADALGAARVRFTGTSIAPVVTVDQTFLERFLHEQFDAALPPTHDARWQYQNGALTIAPEQAGVTLDIAAIASAIEQAFNQSTFSSPLPLATRTDTPGLTATDLEATRSLVESFLAKRPFLLTANEKKWELDPTTLVSALRVDRGGFLQKPTLLIDETSLVEKLQTIRDAVQKPAVDARLTVSNGKIEEFSPSQDGLTLDTRALIKHLEVIANGDGGFPIALTTIAEPAKITIASVNELGIEELLGVGKSNFKGSPKNRRINIAVGARAVNGTIVPSGEEFSLVKVLGTIDGTTGYLPELVIKENKTIPEFGGGLCQIGTTVFRGALSSGLPITERQNHSYRVVYYEPAGTDATIYPQHPDMRFKNDTGSAILIVSKLAGDEIAFEFWGKRDGRVASRTEPKIYNITKPAATKTIETTNLKPGEKKCTEHAHNGADAEFTYTVMMPGGEKRERVFTSHYRPWQAVCLVGVEKKPDTPTAVTPTELPPPPDLPATLPTSPSTLPNPDLPTTPSSTPY